MANLRNDPSTRRLALLCSVGAFGLLGASAGCELIASVDPDLLNQGGGGGGTATTTSSTTTTTTTTTTTSSTTTSSTTTGGGGGQGGQGTGGSDTCDGPETCPDPGECQTATCDNNVCGASQDNEGATCDNVGADDGLCTAGGACVECLDVAQCGDPSNDCREVTCLEGACGEANLADDTVCDGGLCAGGMCDVLQQCTNNQIDDGETDIDCGGPCPNCDNKAACLLDEDCRSDVCDALTCVACALDDDCNGTDYCEDEGANDGRCRPTVANGTACDREEECTSGFCPEDGVCCNAPCDGTCEACGGGSCAPIAVGTDPDMECTAECLTTCIGTSPACGNAATNVTCGPAVSCAGSTLTVQDTCGTDTGTCEDSGTQSCAPYNCNAGGTACRTACTDSTQCTAGNFCDGVACVPLRDNGDGCTVGTQCSSTMCIDDVCCGSACGNACDACDLGGSMGTCTAVADGTPGAPPCAGNLLCSGAATCPATCGVDGDCVGGFYCDDGALGSTFACIVQGATGAACTDDRQCTSTCDVGTSMCN